MPYGITQSVLDRIEALFNRLPRYQREEQRFANHKASALNRKLRSPVNEVHQLPGLLRLDPLRLFHKLCSRATRALLPGLVRRPPPVLVRRNHSREDPVYRLEVGTPPSVHVHGTCHGTPVAEAQTQFLVHASLFDAPRERGAARTGEGREKSRSDVVSTTPRPPRQNRERVAGTIMRAKRKLNGILSAQQHYAPRNEGHDSVGLLDSSNSRSQASRHSHSATQQHRRP